MEDWQRCKQQVKMCLMEKCEESLLLARRNDCVSIKYIAEYSILQTDDVYLLNHRFNVPIATLSPVPWLTP